MKHPPHVWVDPSYAQEDLPRLAEAYAAYCRGRSQPASTATVMKYEKTLLSLMRSLQRQGLPLVLESITPQAVSAWVQEQRTEGRSEDGIAGRLSAVKVFTSKYIYKHLELTTRDLLLKVSRITPPNRAAEPLTDAEIEHLLDCFDGPGFLDIRNRALVVFYIVTGMRLQEVLDLQVNSVDMVTGEVKAFVGKGRKERQAWLSPGALRHLKAYLKVRPRGIASTALWVQDNGNPLSYWGVHSIMRRLRDRSKIARLHWHLFRHGFAQHALRMGADPGTVQEMLGHSSNAMTRKYLGQVKQSEAAKRMPKYARI
jgi:integrase/recombinase XerC